MDKLVLIYDFKRTCLQDIFAMFLLSRDVTMVTTGRAVIMVIRLKKITTHANFINKNNVTYTFCFKIHMIQVGRCVTP